MQSLHKFMQNYPTKKRLAFTLIELIGVIAIIALLAAFLIPKIIDVIRDAAVTSTIASINNVRSGAATYASQNGSFTVATDFDGTLVTANMLDKKFSTKLGVGDIEVVAGSITPGDPGYFELGNAGTITSTTKDKIVIATITGVSYRDVKKLQEFMDSDASWTGSQDNVGKVKAVAAGSLYAVTIYITQ